MSHQRVYKSSDYMQVSDGEPIRSVVVESEHSVIVAWHVEPGQSEPLRFISVVAPLEAGYVPLSPSGS